MSHGNYEQLCNQHATLGWLAVQHCLCCYARTLLVCGGLWHIFDSICLDRPAGITMTCCACSLPASTTQHWSCKCSMWRHGEAGRAVGLPAGQLGARLWCMPTRALRHTRRNSQMHWGAGAWRGIARLNRRKPLHGQSKCDQRAR